MLSFKNILAVALACGTGSLAAAVAPVSRTADTNSRQPNKVNCGAINIVAIGLPWNHPLVTQEGFDPTIVEAALREDHNAIVDAGYNVKTLLFGPEEDSNEILSHHMAGVNWAATGVGYDVRGGNSEEITVHFENVVQIFHDSVTNGRMIFNSAAGGHPGSMVPAIQRHFQTVGDCRKFHAPGKDLARTAFFPGRPNFKFPFHLKANKCVTQGLEVICSDSVCVKPYGST